MPNPPIAGDHWVPKVAASFRGVFHSASLRMVYDFSKEDRSVFQLPGGQSGHFLSPHYRDQFESWYQGTPQAFLAGPTVHTTVFQNQGG